MRLVSSLLLLAACISAQEVSESVPEPSSDSSVSTERLDRCTTLGFDVDALDCRLCDELSTFLTEKVSKKKVNKTKSVKNVVEECQECCSDFSKVLEAEGRRYPKVALAVNRRRLKRYPKVANFVDNHAEQIKGLEVQETDPRLPMLEFYDENGEKIEEISVAHWDEDSIAEFIANKLLPQQEKEEKKEENGEGAEEVVEEEIVEVEVEAEP